MKEFLKAAAVSAAAGWVVCAAAGAVEFRAPAERPVERVKGCLFVEAEAFADYGSWRLDTQFTHKMGSAYLIAPGVLKPIGAAKTTVDVPRTGTWRAWVRTKDWLPGHSPGKFALEVGGTRSGVLGASGRPGWRWEKAGDFALAAGAAELKLVDLSGAFARCDAVLLTTDLTYVPPDGGTDLVRERQRFLGLSAEPEDAGEYDVVVVGAGTAGMGAALAAARGGAKTLLVHDRPVLGGNSSRELGIGTDGAAGAHPNHNVNARETGLVEEANLTRKLVADRSLSEAYARLCAAEKTLTVVANRRVVSVEKSGDRIAAAIARDTLTGRYSRIRGQIFIDATGDGWVGRFAGAELMHGREAQREFNEAPAPETRDDLMMSGCLMDGYLAYRTVQREKPVAYATPKWADVLPEGFTRYVRSIAPTWWIEHHGRFDELEDPERARDELVRIVFAYWGWVKNVWKGPGSEKAELVSVPFMNGRREGYRLVGDYVLTANDCLEGRLFDDRISYGGWPLDTHDPLGMENPHGNGYWKNHPGVPIYSIPYRCLYSKNIPNLMMAGRDVSVTHIALGSVRVEATLFCLGQAAGTAAAMATADGLTPREVGARRIRELQQRLLKDDMYIPDLKNEDPLDLARTAHSVTATSVQTRRRAVFGEAHAAGDLHSLDAHDRACGFARGELDRIEGLQLQLANDAPEPVEVTVEIFDAEGRGTGPRAADRVATGKVHIAPGRTRFAEVALTGPVRLTRKWVWIVCRKAKGVSWQLQRSSADFVCARAYGVRDAWTVAENHGYGLRLTPEYEVTVDTKPEYVIDGVARPVGACLHGWVSNPEAKLPQAIELAFARPVTANSLRLTFDTDLTPKRTADYPRTLVRDYAVEVCDSSGRWRRVAAVEDNGFRLRVHDFPEQAMTALKVTVTATWGDSSVRIQEIRLYHERERERERPPI